MINGITAALNPSASFRASPSENFRRTRWLENQPPHRHRRPRPHKESTRTMPTALMSKPRASYKYFGSQKR